MKLKVDRQADALYLSLSDEAAYETEEVSPGIVIDYNKDGQAVGIEMLYLSKRAPIPDIERVLFEAVPLKGTQA